ncbi:Tctex-1 family-domain-containing protein [Zopfochytrium polystomum]|nr:Tctex-1 family-domain-containing protein [Zopfochytrium polystomum]
MVESQSQQLQGYTIRPNHKQKFRPSAVSAIIKKILADRLTGVVYQPDLASQTTRELADEIKASVKNLDLSRYKIAVHVVIGEMRGEGVRMGCRCLWDADTDSMAQETFMNVSE